MAKTGIRKTGIGLCQSGVLPLLIATNVMGKFKK